MRTIVLIGLPALLLIAYVATRRRRAKKRQRQSLNIVTSLVLLGYFGVTVGLGLFWVAKQELPIFDLHYLFGYATVTLVVLHVSLSWRRLEQFFRRRAPAALLTEGGEKWRPKTRALGIAAFLLCYGGLAFFVGRQYGNDQFTLSHEATAGGARLMVESKDGRRFVAEHYHARSALGRKAGMPKSGSLYLADRPPLYKRYPDATTVALPRTNVQSNADVASAIAARHQKPSSATLSLPALASILRYANGLTGALRGGSEELRAAPSAGALYPTEIYVAVRDVIGLKPGLYNYAVDRHALQLVASGDLAEKLALAVDDSGRVETAAATIILSAVFLRTAFKYGDRSYRYVAIDTGHVAGNLTLAAAALDQPTALLGRFDDDQVNALLGVDDRQEVALLLVALGGKQDQEAGRQPAFLSLAPPQLQGASSETPAQQGLIALIHQNTRLARGKPARLRGSRIELGSAAATAVPLPQASRPEAKLFETIISRRSTRRFTDQPLSGNVVSALLQHGLGKTPVVVEGSQALRFHVVVNHVVALQAGIYQYLPNHDQLQVRKVGDQRDRLFEAGLSQEVLGEADLAIVMTVDLEALSWPDGDRGLRYAYLEAGLAGENLYLVAGALGLGICGVGAFYDHEMAALLGVEPKREVVSYIIAVGSVGQ